MLGNKEISRLGSIPIVDLLEALMQIISRSDRLILRRPVRRDATWHGLNGMEDT